MTQEELQNLAIEEADKILKAQGLPAYRVLEERLFMALTACHDSVEMGKTLVRRLTQAEKEIKRLKEKKEGKP